MKKWQYKIVPLQSMVETQSNHDIEVSVEEGKSRKEGSRKKMETALNKLGGQGWEMVGSFRDFVLLKKEK